MGRPAQIATFASLTLLALVSGCNNPSSPSSVFAAASSVTATVSRVDLGTLGGAVSYATDINDAGVVVGWSDDASGVNRAFRWTPAHGMVDLGTLRGDQWSRAISVTSTGQILGVSGRTGDFIGRPVTWASSGPATLLAIPLLPGGSVLDPADRNGSGQAIGSTVGGTFPSHAWIWSRAFGIYDITAHMPGDIFESYGTEINQGGLVVGTNRSPVCTNPHTENCWHAFVWSSPTRFHDLGIPVGSDLSSAAVTGSALNDLGVVVGSATLSPGSGLQPYRWTDKSGFTLLPTFSPSPDIYGYAQAVNFAGTTVGASRDALVGAIQAAAWPGAGGIVKLNGSDLNSSVAVAVNGSGLVVGSSSLDCCGFVTHATLWRLGSGRGTNTPTLAGLPSSSVVAAARIRSEAALSGPAGCLSDAHAIMSRHVLIDCVVTRGK